MGSERDAAARAREARARVEAGMRSRPTRAELRDAGRARRDDVPPAALAELGSTSRDPVAILRAQDVDRRQDLVPLRWGRMRSTPFTLFRGAAAVMAADLATLPTTGIEVHLCGDAHLANFGVFAAPDRRLVFDLNDFDETLPGPFEWDVLRLAASVVVAARANGIGRRAADAAVSACVDGYRRAIRRLADMDPLDVWYSRVDVDDVIALARRRSKAGAKAVTDVRSKAARRTQLGAIAKHTEVVDGRRRIVHAPPLVVRLGDDWLAAELPRIQEFLVHYVMTLPEDRRRLLRRYSVVDVAMKVVGVGSVGTRCFLMLGETGDGETMFLQLKEANASVLEAHLGPSGLDHHGERVVRGQRLIQSATDSFLGFSQYEGDGGRTVDCYVRQLWDGKASVDVDDIGAGRLADYATLCGGTLGRAHARSGEAAMIDGYLGDDDEIDRSVVAFATAYADLTERDHAAVSDAIAAGSVPVA